MEHINSGAAGGRKDLLIHQGLCQVANEKRVMLCWSYLTELNSVKCVGGCGLQNTKRRVITFPRIFVEWTDRCIRTHVGCVGNSCCMGVRRAPLWLHWAVWEHKVAFSWFLTSLGGLTVVLVRVDRDGYALTVYCKGELSERVWLQRVAKQPGQCPHMECHMTILINTHRDTQTHTSSMRNKYFDRDW